ncbi:aminoglycoside 6'-N-acetyltransferase [Solibacillus sp. FSL W7-1324]|uniref:aminoglycoside 6'-N-acetyltransferase n=1 Tax=Solibacillus sp. FSL W7-1324 TaxID=2921701 RepID=UPI0030F7C720
MIREATPNHASAAARLALLLWPGNGLHEFVQNMEDVITNPNSTVFLAFDDEKLIGFAQCQLRFDYVEGTHSSPVGYLEGLYVEEPYRRQHFAQQLVQACEKWAKSKGCTEFASDCELSNVDSLNVHLKLGFTEANRIICFTKKL